MNTAPQPTEITLHQQSRSLEIAFDDGARYKLPYEFLRVYSPSAEVRGHGEGQEVLQVGKKDVGIVEVEPAGSYALKITSTTARQRAVHLAIPVRAGARSGNTLAQLPAPDGSGGRKPRATALGA